MNGVVLRDVETSDLETLFEHQREPAGVQMAAFPSRDREAFFEHWTKNVLPNETGVVRTILFEDRVAGSIVCFERDGLALIGYWIGQEFWGKGIATEALRAFVQIVARRPLHAYVAKHNVASIRVLEKCGFSIVGEEHAEDDAPEYLMQFASVNPPPAGGS